MSKHKSEAQLLKPRNDLAWREIRGEFVAVDMNSGDYHTFNEVGAFIWRRIIAGRDPESILDEIMAEYKVTREKAGSDFDAFVQVLKSNCLLQ